MIPSSEMEARHDRSIGRPQVAGARHRIIGRPDQCHVQPLSGKKTKFKRSSLDHNGHVLHRRSEGLTRRTNKGSFLQPPRLIAMADIRRSKRRFSRFESEGADREKQEEQV